MDGEESSLEEVFRVRVSLERYFNDERSRCYMSVARHRPVRSLARRLRRAFQLPRPFALVSRGHLLPSLEPLALLQPDDPVEVIPTTIESEAKEAKMCISLHEETMDSTPETERSPQSPATLLWSSVSTRHRPDEVDVPDGLDDMKRRALDILEGFENAPPRRRRRARRQRRRPPAADAHAVEAAPVDAATAAEIPTPNMVTVEATTVDAATGADAPSRTTVTESVVRNGTAQRAPRLVQALCDAAAAPDGPCEP